MVALKRAWPKISRAVVRLEQELKMTTANFDAQSTAPDETFPYSLENFGVFS